MRLNFGAHCRAFLGALFPFGGKDLWYGMVPYHSIYLGAFGLFWFIVCVVEIRLYL